MNKLKKIVLIVFTIIIAFVLYVYIYPEISTRISRSLKVHSEDFLVEGSYYPINMEQITNLHIDSNRVIMTGYDLSFFKPLPEYQIIRNLPDKYIPLKDVDTTWELMGNSEKDGEFLIRTFTNHISNEKFKVWLPYWNADPKWYVFKIAKNKSLFILSEGNWKRSEKVFIAYISVSKK